MQKNLYAVYDVKAAIYLETLMLSHNDVQPCRSFTEAINDKANTMNKHAADFDLHKIGSFNIITGELQEAHQLILTGLKALTPPTEFHDRYQLDI